MLLNMQQKMPFILDLHHSVKRLTDDHKFVSSPGLNRINHQKHILKTKLEFKSN